MPTRLVRDGILDSKAVNSLSEEAELFYRRVMSIVDDYGRFEADADLIRARAFPRQFDRWTPERIARCLTETSGDSRLITVYLCRNKKVFQINNFGQRVQAKPKYPGPDEPCSTVVHGESPSRASRARTESESESESESETKAESLPASPKNGSAATHGSRLIADQLPEEWGFWCFTELQWPTERAQSVWLNFRDYWTEQPGAKGRKVNWIGTWRNWCRKEAADEAKAVSRNGNGSLFPRRESRSEQIDKLMKERGLL